jgi:flotillin
LGEVDRRTRLQGEADAQIILRKGEAEAKAMNVRAEAYKEWNQAAVVDRLITGLPEVVKALASPLSHIDKITIVSTGDGDAAGLNKITNDMAKIAAQIPVLFETLSGMKMSDLLSKVREIGDRDTSERARGVGERTAEDRSGRDSASRPSESN